MKRPNTSFASRSNYYFILFIIAFIVFTAAAFADLWPQYQAAITQNKALIERLDILSKAVDSTSKTIINVTEKIKLTDELTIPKLVTHRRDVAHHYAETSPQRQTDSTETPIVTLVTFQPRFYAFFGEYNNFYSAKRRYAELLENHHVTTGIIRLGADENGRHIVVLPDDITQSFNTESEAIALAYQYRNLSAIAICLYASDRYRKVLSTTPVIR